MTTHTEPKLECGAPLQGGSKTVPRAELAAVLWMVQHATPPVVVISDHINHVITCRRRPALACDNVAGPHCDLWRGIAEATADWPLREVADGLDPVALPVTLSNSTARTCLRGYRADVHCGEIYSTLT